MTSNQIAKIETAAKILVDRREKYVRVLEAVPAPKAEPVDFPYASIEAAARDGFLLIGGPEVAFGFLAKGYKTVAWRQRADKNRSVRDELAGLNDTTEAK